MATDKSTQIPTWSVMQPILAPRTMLGPFVWWAILGCGLDGLRLKVTEVAT